MVLDEAKILTEIVRAQFGCSFKVVAALEGVRTNLHFEDGAIKIRNRKSCTLNKSPKSETSAKAFGFKA